MRDFDRFRENNDWEFNGPFTPSIPAKASASRQEKCIIQAMSPRVPHVAELIYLPWNGGLKARSLDYAARVALPYLR